MQRVRVTDPLEMLRKRQLSTLLKISPWTIDRYRKNDPSFPKPIRLSETTLVWPRRDVEEWLRRKREAASAQG